MELKISRIGKILLGILLVSISFVAVLVFSIESGFRKAEKEARNFCAEILVDDSLNKVKDLAIAFSPRKIFIATTSGEVKAAVQDVRQFSSMPFDDFSGQISVTFHARPFFVASCEIHVENGHVTQAFYEDNK